MAYAIKVLGLFASADLQSALDGFFFAEVCYIEESSARRPYLCRKRASWPDTLVHFLTCLPITPQESLCSAWSSDQ